MSDFLSPNRTSMDVLTSPDDVMPRHSRVYTDKGIRNSNETNGSGDEAVPVRKPLTLNKVEQPLSSLMKLSPTREISSNNNNRNISILDEDDDDDDVSLSKIQQRQSNSNNNGNANGNNNSSVQSVPLRLASFKYNRTSPLAATSNISSNGNCSYISWFFCGFC